jgi:hypothetical protein
MLGSTPAFVLVKAESCVVIAGALVLSIFGMQNENLQSTLLLFGLIHNKGASTAAASAPTGPRARL